MPGAISEGGLAQTMFASFDVVVVPFPFTDRATTKRRPALVLSSPQFAAESDHLVAAMVTTSTLRWSSDTELHDIDEAGLVAGSVVRAKLFTLPIDLVLRPLGRLTERDINGVRGGLSHVLEL